MLKLKKIELNKNFIKKFTNLVTFKKPSIELLKVIHDEFYIENDFERKKIYIKNNSNLKNLKFSINIIELYSVMLSLSSKNKYKSVRSLIDLFILPNFVKVKVIELINQAIKDNRAPQNIAKDITKIYPNNKDLLKQTLFNLIKLLNKKEFISIQEMEILYNITNIFELEPEEINKILIEIIVPKPLDPIQYFGLTKKVNKRKLNQIYKNFVKNCHPDNLNSPDIAKEYIAVISEKFNRANICYNYLQNN